MTSVTNRDARALAARIRRLEDQMRVANRTSQLGYSSIEGRAIVVVDTDGVDRGTVGVLPDGTVGVLATNGPPPPQPTPPVLVPVVTALSVVWDGGWTGGDVTPLDLARVEVHVGADAGFDTDTTTFAGSIERPDGGAVLVAATADTTTWVRLVAVTTSGVPGTASEAVSQVAAGGGITYYQPEAPADPSASITWVDTDDGNRAYRWDGAAWVEVTDARVLAALAAAATAQATADGKIRTYAQPDPPPGLGADDVGDLWFDTDAGNRQARWDGTAWVLQPVGAGAIGVGAVDGTAVSGIPVDKITSGTVNAQLVVANRLTTSPTATGQRAEFNSGGLQAYDTTGALAVNISGVGPSTFKGAITSGSTITGAMITASTIRATGTGDVNLTSTGHAFQVGPTSGMNVAIDANEVVARNNGRASTLGLNWTGGNVNVGLYGSGHQNTVNNLTTIHEADDRTVLTLRSWYDFGYSTYVMRVLAAEEPSSAWVFAAYNNNENTTATRMFTLRGDGQAYAAGAWNSGGADFAEMFESADGSHLPPGRAVTLVVGKVRLAAPGEFVLGVTSAAATVVGNSPTNWPAMYLRDVYGQYVLDGGGHRQLNPSFDPALVERYVPRTDRPEWSPVSLIGQVTADDDGTCLVGGLAEVAAGAGGRFTASDIGGYRVIERLDATHVRVLVIPSSPLVGAKKKPKP